MRWFSFEWIEAKPFLANQGNYPPKGGTPSQEPAEHITSSVMNMALMGVAFFISRLLARAAALWLIKQRAQQVW
jgi:hypothetical protein